MTHILTTINDNPFILLLFFALIALALVVVMVGLFGLVKQIRDISQRLAVQEEWMISASRAPDGLIKQLMEQLRDQLALLTEASAHISSHVNEASDKLKQASFEMAKNGKDSADHATMIGAELSAQANQLNALNKSLGTTHDSLEGRLKDHVVTMKQENERLLSMVGEINATSATIEGAAGGIEDRLKQSLFDYEALQERLRQTGNDFTQAVGDAVKEHNDKAVGCKDHLISAAEDLRQVQENIIDEAKQAAAQISSQRQDLAATTAQARKGAEQLGIILAEKLSHIREQGTELNDQSGQHLDKLANIITQLQTHIEMMGTQTSEIERRLYSHSEETISKLKENSNEIITSLTPVLENTDKCSNQLQKQSTSLNEISDKTERQTLLIEELLDKGREWQKSMEENIADLSQLKTGISKEKEAISDTINEASQTLIEAGQIGDETAQKIADSLKRQSEDFVNCLKESHEALNANKGGFSKTIAELHAAAQKAIGDLDQYREELSANSENLTTRTVDAGRQFEEHNELLKALSYELSKVTNQAGEELERIEAQFKNSEETLRMAQKETAEGWQSLSDRLSLQVNDIDEVNQHVLEQMNNISEGLAGQREWLERITQMADNAMTGLLQNMNQETQNLSELSTTLEQRLNETLSNIKVEISTLGEVGQRSLSEAEAIKDEYEVGARDLFNRTSRHIIEDLNSISIDLTRALDGEVPEADWRRYVKGDRTIFSRGLLRNRQDALIRKIADRVRNDGAMRGYVTRYVELFDQLLEGATKSDSENLLHATFLTSDVGKLYMLLDKALGNDG